MAEAYETRIHKLYWGLLSAVHYNQIVAKTDILVLWCHYVMERNGLKNAGLGDDDDTELPEKKDMLEILPDGWNDRLPCRIRYVHDGTLYILSICPPDGDDHCMIKLKRPRDNKMSFSGLNLFEIPKVKGRLEEIMPNYAAIMDRFNKELIYPLIKKRVSPRGMLPPPRFGTVNPLARPPARGFFSEVNPMGRGAGMVVQPPGIRVGPSFMPGPPVSRGAIPRRVRFNPNLPAPRQGQFRGRARFGIPPNTNNSPRPGPSGDNPNPDNPAFPGYNMFS